MKIEDIVLIDDDEDEFLLFADAVKGIDQHIQIRHVSGPGCEGKARQECSLPQLLFLDINMPHRDGFEWLKWLRSGNYNIPVVMYSTSQNVEKICQSYHLGADLYLTKPIGFVELQRALHSILDMDWSQPEKIRNHYFADGRCRPFCLEQA